MAGIELDGVNQKVVLDSDGDTYLEAATDDTVKIYVAGAHDATISANAINVLSGTTLTIDSGATITNSGTANGFGSNEPSSADGQALGSASAEWSDLFLADGGIIKFGNDQDTLLTHTDGTGLTLNSTNKLCFNDASQYIQGASGTVLDIAATDEIELTATLLDVNANLDVSGTSLLPTLGVITAKDLGVGIHIRTSDSGGSVSTDADELVLESSAEVGMTMLGGTGNDLAINFGDSGDNDIGRLIYANNGNRFIFVANATDTMSINSDDGNVDLLVGNLHTVDDRGIVFGTNEDLWLGGNPGEASITIMQGNTNTRGTNEGDFQFDPGDGDDTYQYITGGEGSSGVLYLSGDQGDDNADQMRIQMLGSGTQGMYFAYYADGVWDNEFFIGDDAVTSEHTISVSGIDYAEFFEWKTELANDAKIKETYGLTVVLDGNKVRLAEAGEEAKVLGVIRPSKVAGTVGGNGLYWKDKYKKDAWGEYEKEAYTQVNWHNLDADGGSKKHYSFMKDRIPQYELLKNPGIRDTKDWHLLDSNFKRDKDGNKIVLVVPSTDEEKAASRYTERTTHRQTGETLMRKVFSDSFDKSKTYVDRDKRRKEWAVVGLLGQVPVRDTAIIPTHWTKMKNIDTGIDLYYIK